jgi:hypothetical protein
VTAVPVPPPWAVRSVDERDRVVHERLSRVHPRVSVDFIGRLQPTDVSVSVVDLPSGETWARGTPTVQVEGGSYSVADAWQLWQALHEVLVAVGERDPDG